MIPITRTTGRAGVSSADVYSEEFERRRIYLTGGLDDSSAADICAQINHLAAKSREDIFLIIQSPGGSVSAGMAILDTMQSCGCDICTVVLGEAASMGAFLASMGTGGKRYIGSHAEMMIHQPLGGASGQASDIERTAAHILRVKQKLHLMLAESTGKSYEQICTDCDRDHYLNAAEAIEYGLVDEIFSGFSE